MTKPMKFTSSEFKELAKLCRCKYPDGKIDTSIKSIALEGAPGMGKTAVVRSLAEDWELPFITLAINLWSQPADVVGFAYKGSRNTDGSMNLSAEDEVPPWLPVWRKLPDGTKVQTTDATKGLPVAYDDFGNYIPHPAVVLLDEFSAANPKIQNAFLTICLTKIVKNFRLDPDTTFFGAFNSCRRKGFEGCNFEISDALMGCNARFDVIELVFEEKPVKEAVMRNKTISKFWKAFTEKFFHKLNIYDETIVGDSNVSGRTYENLLIRLSIGHFDSKCWNAFAEKVVKMEMLTSPKVAERFISFVKTFDLPTGEDYLNGTAKVETFSDAIVGANEIVRLLGFRKRCGETIISTQENALLKTFVNTEYPTGTIRKNGTKIIGSKIELCQVLKSAIYQEGLETLPELKWIADTIDGIENPETESEDETPAEF